MTIEEANLLTENQLLQKEIANLTQERDIYKRFIDYSYDWEYWIDEHNKLVYTSTSCERITGYAAKEFYQNGDLLTSIIHPEDRQHFLHHVHSMDEDGRRIPIEYRIIRKDHKIAWIGHTCENVYNSESNFKGIRGCNRLITHQKTVEQTLKDNTEMLNSAQRIAQIGNWQLHLQSQQLTWSDEIYRIFEIDKEQCKASYETFLNAIHPDDREWVNNTYKESLLSKRPYSLEHRLLMADGRIKYVQEQCETEYDHNGTPKISRGTVQDITQRKNIELELKKSQQQLQLIFDSSPTVMLLLDKNAKILKLNKTGLELAGRSIEDVKHKSGGVAFNCIASLHDIPACGKDPLCGNCKIRATIIDTLQNGTPHHKVEASLIAQQNGKLIEYTVLVSTIIVSEQPEKTILVLLDDITERKKREEDIHRLSSIVEQSPSTIVITDLDGNIEYVNPAFEKSTGYTLAEAIGKNPKILNARISENATYENLWQTITKGGVWNGSFVNKKKSGEHYHEKAVISPIFNHNQKATGYFAIKEDITQQINTLHALEESQERFHELFQHMSNGCIVYRFDENTSDFEIIDANRASERIEGIQKTDILGKKVTEVFAGIRELGLFDVFLRVFKTGVPEHFPVSYYDDNRLSGWRENYVYKLGNNNVVAVYEDKTKEKEAEIEIFRQYKELSLALDKVEKSEHLLREANAAKDKFFNIIAHDLRSPFNSIIVFSELLLKQGSKYNIDEHRNFIEHIHSSAKQTFNLLKNLLDWARSQTGQVTYTLGKYDLFDIAQNVALSLMGAAQVKHIDLQVKINNNFMVYCDKDMLLTVLRNLVNNAIKFTPDGGTIELNAIQESAFHIISVSDNGIGMDPKVLDNLFDITKKTTELGTHKEEGTGLGLLLCKEFINKHGGEIEVKSKKGEGSTFLVKIPVPS